MCTIPFFDLTRERPLITEVFYPIASTNETIIPKELFQRSPQSRDAPFPNIGKFPLVLFSHGDGGSRLDNSWLMESLAAKGYIVVSIDHYGNTDYLNLPAIALKRWERPKDVTFVLRKLLKHPKIGSLIETNRIAFAGFSLGGTTGIWLAGG